MANIFKKTIVCFILGFFLVNIFAVKVFAQDYKYSVLAPLPGTTEGTCDPNNPGSGCETTLQKYLPGVFNLAIGLSAVFAVIVIVVGGFKYMTTDALQGKEDGKNMVWNAVKGLFLVIGAWLILYTINPDLLNLKLTIDRADIAKPAGASGGTLGGATTGGTPMTDAEIIESNAVRLSLENEGIYTYTGPCIYGQTKGCVNLNGLTDTTKDGLVSLKNSFGQNITITGGTEAGHSATGGHPTGDSVDLGFSYNNASLATYVDKNKVAAPVQTSLGPQYTLNINGRTVTFLKESDHWHVTFK